ncbi:hypothetical protein [Tabrizicola sp. TH137]|uniref:hypothetical protein n=1 Tax=Tabrizicola sp. TH137 TaxID=2067452 RepID=UPI00117C54EC|nr:hypothetical protein [Tabrizicola sp. TH137]
MEYHGFISTLIDRSEKLLPLDRPDELDVTRLLLVLNTGFALVRDRIRYWNDANDGRLRGASPWKDVQKACKSRLDKPISLNGQVFFDDFRTSRDWTYLRVSREAASGQLSAYNVVQCLRKAEEIPSDGLKLDAVMWAMRNSFAHGGILPMSPSQAGQRIRPSANQLHDARHIDRVYFVSKWTGDSIQDDLGWIVMEFGLTALRTFWEDWKALILVPGLDALDQLDRVA